MNRSRRRRREARTIGELCNHRDGRALGDHSTILHYSYRL